MLVNDACVDIDECDQNPCKKQYEICVNSIGSYECECQPGFYRNISNGMCIRVEPVTSPTPSLPCSEGYREMNGTCVGKFLTVSEHICAFR